MKSFDKRSVPGLEDCSSDSDSDNEITAKKSRYDDDIEIELEVKNNEFLKETPMADNVLLHKKHNSIWGNVVEDEMLDENLKKCGMNKVNVNRSIESYTISDKFRNNKRHLESSSFRKKRKFNTSNKNVKLSVKDRILNRTFNRNKSRNHIKVDPHDHNPTDAIFKIAQALLEPKVELIEKCYYVLGLDKCLEFLYMTEDIEESGGLLVLNGSRRRSPGGVFLNLIKESNDISNEDKKQIFVTNFLNKKLGVRKDLIHNKCNLETSSLINIELIQPENNTSNVPPHELPVLNKEEDLEDGEIP